MVPKYQVGQKVIIMQVKKKRLSPRDFELQPYAGQTGRVTDYYWIDLDRGARVFYIYTVELETSYKTIVVHEDELKAYTV